MLDIVHARIQRVGTGWKPPPHPPPALLDHKALGFLSNTGRDPLENHKAFNDSNLGHF